MNKINELLANYIYSDMNSAEVFGVTIQKPNHISCQDWEYFWNSIQSITNEDDIKEAYEDGFEDGYNKGYDTGLDEGYEDGLRSRE